ncbi:MAG: LacI family DNA-binding transcriptional regulator [Lachnospiraceae bacterium]|nr:LacI family DNA-binding transcriptional regulator [Lachnospiraceae bacterium]
MTMEELARQLGVSKSTVSRALSGKGRIAEDTREQIRACAAKYGMTAERKAHKSLVHTYNLGVSLPVDVYNTSIPFFQECLMGICEVAAKRNYNVLITNRTADDISAIRALVEQKKVDGIILTRCLEEDAAVKYLTKKGFPTAMTGRCSSSKVIQVDCDNYEASKALVKALVQKGYRRFAMVLGNMSYSVNAKRKQGFQEALKEQGIAVEQQLIYINFDKTDFLDNLIQELMSKRVECVICGDDVICTVLTSRLQSEGYRIPKDISVASLHNSSNLECFTPAITAVNVDAKSLGRQVGTQMLDYLMGNSFQQSICVDYEILMKKSTAGIWREK